MGAKRKPAKKPTPKPKADREMVKRLTEQIEFTEYEGLNEGRNRFVFWYARLNSAKAAAINAGYSKRSARELGYKILQDPKVQEAIKAERKRHLDAMGIDESFVLLRLKQLSDDCAPGGDMPNPSVSARATELLGKTMRMFTDQVDHTIGLKKTHEEALAELDDQELDDDGREGDSDPPETAG